jgi:hypothetical protein
VMLPSAKEAKAADRFSKLFSFFCVCHSYIPLEDGQAGRMIRIKMKKRGGNLTYRLRATGEGGG